MNIKERCCCFTGHRKIAPEHINTIEKNLHLKIRELIEKGVTDFVTGGALGFDTVAALAIIKERDRDPSVHLILALPCKNQTAGWHSKDVQIYNEILSLADEVIWVSENYTSNCMHKRNEFMCDNSARCVFYMTSPRGGTAYTVRYALENKLEMHNIMYI